MAATPDALRAVCAQGTFLTRIGGEAPLVDEERGSADAVNCIAARLWMLCDSEALAKPLGRDDQLGSDTVPDDVERTLVTLRELGVVEVAAAA